MCKAANTRKAENTISKTSPKKVVIQDLDPEKITVTVTNNDFLRFKKEGNCERCDNRKCPADIKSFQAWGPCINLMKSMINQYL